MQFKKLLKTEYQIIKINIKQILKFGIVGFINTSITVLTIFVLYKLLGIEYLIANVIGFILGFTNSFFMNKLWTFKSNGKIFTESIFFVIVFVISYFVQFIVLIFFKDVMNINTAISQLIALAFYTITNYIGNKVLTFREKSLQE